MWVSAFDGLMGDSGKNAVILIAVRLFLIFQAYNHNHNTKTHIK